MDIQRTLAQIGERLTKARDDLRIVEEQLVFQQDVLEEAETRMLVSETPLADREHRIARDDYERLARQRAEAQRLIDELQAEQDGLLDRMLGANR
ncbi:MAG: hypothetical protein ABR575_03785 [Actinomycetota bacterium]